MEVEADAEEGGDAGPVRQDYPLMSSPELEQVRKLMQVANIPVVQIRAAGMDISLRR